MRGSLRKAGSREAQPCCESEEFLKGKIEAYDQTGRMTNASFDNNNNKKMGMKKDVVFPGGNASCVIGVGVSRGQ